MNRRPKLSLRESMLLLLLLLTATSTGFYYWFWVPRWQAYIVCRAELTTAITRLAEIRTWQEQEAVIMSRLQHSVSQQEQLLSELEGLSTQQDLINYLTHLSHEIGYEVRSLEITPDRCHLTASLATSAQIHDLLTEMEDNPNLLLLTAAWGYSQGRYSLRLSTAVLWGRASCTVP